MPSGPQMCRRRKQAMKAGQLLRRVYGPTPTPDTATENGQGEAYKRVKLGVISNGKRNSSPRAGSESDQKTNLSQLQGRGTRKCKTSLLQTSSFCMFLLFPFPNGAFYWWTSLLPFCVCVRVLGGVRWGGWQITFLFNSFVSRLWGATSRTVGEDYTASWDPGPWSRWWLEDV